MESKKSHSGRTKKYQTKEKTSFPSNLKVTDEFGRHLPSLTCQVVIPEAFRFKSGDFAPSVRQKIITNGK